MDQLLKWLQAGAFVSAVIGAAIAAVKFLSELKAGRLQREQDLRWRQAQAGKALNDEMQTDPLAWPALQMLDSDHRRFKTPAGLEVVVAQDDIPRALDVARFRDDDKSTFVRDAFDTLFYFMAMFEHYIASGLIRPDDVAYPMEYYVPLLARYRGEVSGYLERYDLRRTRTFLERYESWGATSTKRRPATE